jgi:hypothetical protein
MKVVAKFSRLINTLLMKYRRLISSIMLLLAVWLPLDNALAGAVVQGCPMMSHAFERGLHTTFMPSDAQSTNHGSTDSPHCPMMMHTASNDAPSSGHDQCGNGCTHCGLCLLLGGVALQLNAPAIPVTPVLPHKIISSLPATHTSVSAPLFRPPIA